VSMTDHVWGAASLVMAKPVWDGLSPEDQAAVKAAAQHWGEEQRRMVAESQNDFIAKLKEKGMEFNEVDKPAFVAAVQPVWEAQKDAFGPELMGIYESYRQ